MLPTLRYFHPNLFTHQLSRKKEKALYGITTFTTFLPPPRPPVRSRAYGPPSVGPLFRALIAPQGAPLMRRLRTASSLMPTAPYAEFSYVSTCMDGYSA